MVNSEWSETGFENRRARKRQVFDSSTILYWSVPLNGQQLVLKTRVG